MNHSGAKYTIAIVIPKVITLLFIPALIFYDENNRLEIYVLIIVMATLTGFIYSFINGFKDVVLNKEKIQWKLNELRSALNYGLPMLGSSLIYWAMTSSNAIILKNYTNLGELGRYSLIISLAGVAGVIQSIVTTIWTPIAYQWKIDENNNKNFTLATSIVSILASTVVLSVIIFSSLILNFLPKKYENLEYLLPVAVIPIMFYTISEVSSIGIALANKTILNMIATAIACSINIFLSILLVEDYGLKGVLISSAIAHYVFLVFRTLFSCKVCFIQPVYKLFMSTLICMLFSIIIAIYEIDEWLKILSAIIIFIAIIIIHIKEMLEVVKFYEKKML
jgi:O-antigen/teichoic acid export membrane protein